MLNFKLVFLKEIPEEDEAALDQEMFKSVRNNFAVSKMI